MRHTRLNIHVGNLLELVGVIALCFGVARLAGVGWAIVLAGVVLILWGNLSYSRAVLRVPLPAPRRDVRAARRAVARPFKRAKGKVGWKVRDARYRARGAWVARRSS